jgi:hypothetical protein
MDYLKKLKSKSNKPVEYTFVDYTNLLFSEDTQFVLYYIEKIKKVTDQNNGEEHEESDEGTIGYMLCPELFSTTEGDNNTLYSVRLSQKMVEGIRTKLQNCEIKKL